jgi:hypothetical protein
MIFRSPFIGSALGFGVNYSTLQLLVLVEPLTADRRELLDVGTPIHLSGVGQVSPFAHSQMLLTAVRLPPHVDTTD